MGVVVNHEEGVTVVGGHSWTIGTIMGRSGRDGEAEREEEEESMDREEVAFGCAVQYRASATSSFR